MDPSIIHTATLTALKDGKSLEEIYAFGTEANIDKTYINQSLRSIANDSTYEAANFLSQLDHFKIKDDSEEDFVWDPFRSVKSDSYLQNVQKSLRDSFLQKKENSAKHRLFYWSCFAFVFGGLAVWGILFFDLLSYLWSSVSGGNARLESEMLNFKGFISAVIVVGGVVGVAVRLPFWFREYKKMKRFEKKIIKLVIADRFGWKFNPELDEESWDSVRSIVPELFQVGTKEQYIYDQFWGTLNNVPFWAGDFHLITVHYSQGVNTYITNEKHFFAIQLKKPVEGHLHLKSEHIGLKIGNSIFKRDIDVESIDFNKAFKFVYKGKKSLVQSELVRLVPPSLQHRLVQLNRLFGSFDVIINGQLVICMFKNSMIESPSTNFMKHGFVVMDADIEKLHLKMKGVLDIMSELSRCVR